MYPTDRIGPVHIATLGPQHTAMDDDTVYQARTELLTLADRCEPPLLVFDLCEIEYASSLFLELLFRASTRIKKRGGRFALANPSDALRNVMHITRLDTLLNLHESRESAAAALIPAPEAP